MANFMANAVSRLRGYTTAFAGVDIVFRSWNTGTAYSIVATPDASSGESETKDGIVFEHRLRDYKINIDALPVMPQYRDTIEETDDNGIKHYYQLLTDGARRETEPGDNFRAYWRVHTKQVAAPESTSSVYGNAGGVAYGNKNGEGYGGASS